MTTTPILLVMGVSGAGKTTIAKALAERLGWAFLDADDLHPPANHAKMAMGAALDDEDRRPWLAAVAAWIAARQTEACPAVVACSALKRTYRDQLRRAAADLQIVFIRAEPELLAERLRRRRGHFMPPSLLASQFATLEPPAPEEGAVDIDAAQALPEIIDAVVSEMVAHRRRPAAP
ncbi:MAG: gluconokinase [Phenylobacterium sp.]|uniref:gluconokinase n=1 Tax=Phenylobacterium sp. TaxID=1871053 RepID=UPI0027284F80|nr:gluconokinase [Phenylobacterium sp.]MDO8902194.1 gluconokinase [Phenylobacterium sp.]